MTYCLSQCDALPEDTMELEAVRFDREGRVGIIRLNRPERMNAVNERMYRDLLAVLQHARGEPEIRAVVLTGSVRRTASGDKQAFCAGADLKEHAAGRTPEGQREYIRLAHDAVRLLHEIPKPVIAAVNGPARGAGAEMALSCDFVLMADDATIAFSETSLGTFVGGGITSVLPRLVGLMQARRLIYTGTVVDGRAAAGLGLALTSLHQERLLPAAMELGRDLADKAPISLAFAKELLGKAGRLDLEAVLAAEAEAILACMRTEDWREGVASFAARRKPEFKGR